jgi:hypothetical protein
MSNSWGHTLERLSDERIAERAHAKACNCGCRRRRLCTSGRRDHEAPATYLATYNYVTGRAGRVSWASKYVCDDHAAKFAAKHGIDLASVLVQVERPKHALERLVSDSSTLLPAFEDMEASEQVAHLLAAHKVDPGPEEARSAQHDRRHATDLDIGHTHAERKDDQS